MRPQSAVTTALFLLFARILPVKCQDYLYMCSVHDQVAHKDIYRGWEYVALYVNEELAGIRVGRERVLVRLKMNWFNEEAASDTDWFRKWDENVAWGCQAALVTSDVFDIMDTAVYLESKGLLVMLASSSRWPENVRTGMPWKTVWNGAIHSTLYHRGFVLNSMLNGAKKFCVTFQRGWDFGTQNAKDAAKLAENSGLEAVLVPHNKTNWADATVSDAEWVHVMSACEGTDALVAYVTIGPGNAPAAGISLMNHLVAKRRDFKGIFMSDAVTKERFPKVLGEMGDFVTSPTQWHEDIRANCPIFGSNAQFVASFEKRHGEKPHYLSALTAFDALLVILSAQSMASVPITASKLDAGIKSLENTETFFGLVKWNQRNMQGRDPVLLQLQEGVVTPVLPIDIASAVFAWPSPTLQVIRKASGPNVAGVYVRGTDCPVGTMPAGKMKVRKREFVEECEACPKGKFNDGKGKPGGKPGGKGPSGSRCWRCPVGYYSNVTGSSECLACPMTTGGVQMITLSEEAVSQSDCVCPVGTLYVEGICQRCPEEMVCPENSALSALMALRPGAENKAEEGVVPRMLPQYWASWDNPLQIYLCRFEAQCPGGLPETCAAHAHGLCCGRCEVGSYAHDGRCRRCAWLQNSKLLLILPILLGPLIISLMYRLMQSPPQRWIGNRSGMVVLTYLMLLHYQTISLVKTCDIPIHSTVSDAWEIFTYTLDFVSVFRPECAGATSFQVGFVIRILSPIILLAIVLLTYAGRLLLAWLLRSHGIEMDRDSLFNVYMSILYSFCISIGAMSFSLFKCYEHPNGTASLQQAPYIICGQEGDWSDLVVIAVLAVLVYCIGQISLFLYILFIAPNHFHKETFQKRWKFLLSKFQPGCWWWGLMVLAKGLILNVGVALLRTGIAQLYWIIATLIAYLCVLVHYFPWRHSGGNTLDITMHFMLVLVSSLVTYFIPRNDETKTELATYLSILVFGPLVLCFVLVGRLAQHELRKLREPNHHDGSHKHRLQDGAQCTFDFFRQLRRPLAAFAQMDEMEAAPVLSSLADADIQALERARSVICAEFLGEQPSLSIFKMRLVLKRQEGKEGKANAQVNEEKREEECNEVKESKEAAVVEQARGLAMWEAEKEDAVLSLASLVLPSRVGVAWNIAQAERLCERYEP